MKPSSCLPALAPAALLALVALGCTDKTKVSEEKAVAHAADTAKLAETDVEEIRRGLPAGGKKLGELIGSDKEVTPAKVRSALRKTREAVVDLQLAKSTFFAVTDLDGNAYASDQETDGFSGKNLLAPYASLTKAKEGTYIEGLGQMDEAKGVKAGDDMQWVAAAPVPGPEGKPVGLFVTGWSFRRFAFHLEAQLKSNLRNAAKGAEKEPLVYVFVLHGNKAYGTPVSPEVNIKAIEGLNLPEKLKSGGPWHGQVEITNRGYGVAAQPVKKLCDTCSVVVLRSEV